MSEQRSAAEALYPHLKSTVGRPLQQQTDKSLAASMYPTHVKPRPIPEDPFERHMHLMGLIRKDGSRR
jgi:hypothetical protein